MPTFKKDTSPAMKRSGFKLQGYAYPGTSPVRHPHTIKEGAKRDEKVAHGKYGHNTDTGLASGIRPKPIVKK